MQEEGSVSKIFSALRKKRNAHLPKRPKGTEAKENETLGAKVHCASSLSCRTFVRMGSALSVHGLTRLGSPPGRIGQSGPLISLA